MKRYDMQWSIESREQFQHIVRYDPDAKFYYLGGPNGDQYRILQATQRNVEPLMNRDELVYASFSSLAERDRFVERFHPAAEPSVKPVEGVRPLAPAKGPLLPKMPLPPHLQGRVRREGEG